MHVVDFGCTVLSNLNMKQSCKSTVVNLFVLLTLLLSSLLLLLLLCLPRLPLTCYPSRLPHPSLLLPLRAAINLPPPILPLFLFHLRPLKIFEQLQLSRLLRALVLASATTLESRRPVPARRLEQISRPPPTSRQPSNRPTDRQFFSYVFLIYLRLYYLNLLTAPKFPLPCSWCLLNIVTSPSYRTTPRCRSTCCPRTTSRVIIAIAIYISIRSRGGGDNGGDASAVIYTWNSI